MFQKKSTPILRNFDFFAFGFPPVFSYSVFIFVFHRFIAEI